MSGRVAPSRTPAAPRRRAAPPPARSIAWRRWLAVLALVAVLVVALPLGAAVLGDLLTLLLFMLIGGFAIGRATARAAAPAKRRRA